MKTAKRVNLINEKINAQAEEMADLAVTDEQAQQAKGGVGSTVTFTYMVTNPGNVPLSNESVKR